MSVVRTFSLVTRPNRRSNAPAASVRAARVEGHFVSHVSCPQGAPPQPGAGGKANSAEAFLTGIDQHPTIWLVRSRLTCKRCQSGSVIRVSPLGYTDRGPGVTDSPRDQQLLEPVHRQAGPIADVLV